MTLSRIQVSCCEQTGIYTTHYDNKLYPCDSWERKNLRVFPLFLCKTSSNTYQRTILSPGLWKKNLHKFIDEDGYIPVWKIALLRRFFLKKFCIFLCKSFISLYGLTLVLHYIQMLNYQFDISPFWISSTQLITPRLY